MFKGNKRNNIAESEIGSYLTGYCLTRKSEMNHTSSVIDGKLYRTDNAEILGHKEGRTFFRTVKGNYFSAKYSVSDYRTSSEFGVVTEYSDITVETEEKGKEILGLFNVERYQELFGPVEEA